MEFLKIEDVKTIFSHLRNDKIDKFQFQDHNIKIFHDESEITRFCAIGPFLFTTPNFELLECTNSDVEKLNKMKLPQRDMVPKYLLEYTEWALKTGKIWDVLFILKNQKNWLNFCQIFKTQDTSPAKIHKLLDYAIIRLEPIDFNEKKVLNPAIGDSPPHDINDCRLHLIKFPKLTNFLILDDKCIEDQASFLPKDKVEEKQKLVSILRSRIPLKIIETKPELLELKNWISKQKPCPKCGEKLADSVERTSNSHSSRDTSISYCDWGSKSSTWVECCEATCKTPVFHFKCAFDLSIGRNKDFKILAPGLWCCDSCLPKEEIEQEKKEQPRRPEEIMEKQQKLAQNVEVRVKTETSNSQNKIASQENNQKKQSPAVERDFLAFLPKDKRRLGKKNMEKEQKKKKIMDKNLDSNSNSESSNSNSTSNPSKFGESSHAGAINFNNNNLEAKQKVFAENKISAFSTSTAPNFQRTEAQPDCECVICAKKIDDDLVSCKSCKLRYHKSCAGFNEDFDDDDQWVCTNCDKYTMEIEDEGTSEIDEEHHDDEEDIDEFNESIHSSQEETKNSISANSKTKIQRLELNEDTQMPFDISYCPVCKQVVTDYCVQCDDCKKWFHYHCVNLETAPPEDEAWFCPEYHESVAKKENHLCCTDATPIKKRRRRNILFSNEQQNLPKEGNDIPSSSIPCAICGGTEGGENTWVGCDRCPTWCHIRCVGLQAVPPSSELWLCRNCQQKEATNNAM